MRHDDLNTLWKALSDPTRRHILDALRQSPRTTGELSDIFAGEMSRYAVMKHLNVLEEAHLITIRRKGRERYNHLNFVPLQQLYERWLRPYEAEWASSLIHLKNLTEGANAMAGQENSISTGQVEQEIQIQASAEATFASLLDVNGWWLNRKYEYPDSLRLEARVGGRFWETADGSEENGHVWGIVTSIKQNDHITIEGNIGMDGTVQTMTLRTNPQDDGTTVLALSHHYMGLMPEGFAEGMGQGWQYGLNKFKAFVETGERA